MKLGCPSIWQGIDPLVFQAPIPLALNAPRAIQHPRALTGLAW